MQKVYITRMIPEEGIDKLKEKNYEITINPEDRVLSKKELVDALEGNEYDAVLCLLTDNIDSDVLEAAGDKCKIFANYAVGVDNIDLKAAKERNIMISNTPGVLTNTVAEHTFSLILTISRRIVEADKFTREGKFKGWAPKLLLGNDVSGKTIGIVGLGRIGSRVAYHAVNGFDAKVIYCDIKRNEDFEKEYAALYKEKLEDLLKEADYVSLHVPLLPATKHLIDKEKLKIMKKTAYLINTSRRPVIDEEALIEALKNKEIKGAAIDVLENEPQLTPGLKELDNIVLTPHIASGTEETRGKMAEMAALNIITALEGNEPLELVKLK